MIEVTVDEIEGIQFYRNIRILDPDRQIAGMGVHGLDYKYSNDPELLRLMGLLGLRKVCFDLSMRAVFYAQYPMPYVPIKVVQFVLLAYWWVVRFLYNNARVFKQIPPGERFSWHYFTPYTWFKKVKR